MAGQQYTWLIAYGTTPGGLNYSATLTGPGCIAIGTNTCTTAAIPTLSTWGIIALIAMMAVGSFLTLRRRQI
ncbi:IPTL-CTERM sorting domain-containing protein [Acidovorax sp.]|uniref:IPTL-CTERM sorting domain-containing protein n=1 Tax=Acidovorax sp. TaxID=1872122 RepID=UPI0034597FCB